MPDPRFTHEHLSLLERLKEWFERDAQKAAHDTAPVVESEPDTTNVGTENPPL